MICPKCGRTIKDTAKFCVGCGTKVEGLGAGASDNAEKTAALPLSAENADKTVEMPKATTPAEPKPQAPPAAEKPQTVTVFVNDNIGAQTTPPQKKKRIFPLVVTFIIVLLISSGAMGFTVYDAVNNPQRFINVDKLNLAVSDKEYKADTEETTDNEEETEDKTSDKDDEPDTEAATEE